MPPSIAPDLAAIATAAGAKRASFASGSAATSLVQRLWGGYGAIFRVALEGGPAACAVVKWIAPPVDASAAGEARRSHERKLRSYDVETEFYRHFAERCPPGARVPRRWGDGRAAAARWLVLEDLDDAGFGDRRHVATTSELMPCLAWLAAFHARFLDIAPQGLWEEGTYFHLATRPDELLRVVDPKLRAAAADLDVELANARHRTLVHGDAKEANFCFRRDDAGGRVAAVDFQYVGGGAGVRDLAYLLSDRPDDDAAIDAYFTLLRAAVTELHGAPRADAVEDEWRRLYPVAALDFFRFLAGWAPGHYANDRRARAFVARTLAGRGNP